MVNVGEKPLTLRTAVAKARVTMQAETRRAIEDHRMHKGDVFAVAELAGIMGAKHTSQLIPLCHQVPLTQVAVTCAWLQTEHSEGACVEISATVTADYRTGVEMEALTACTIAGLTIYDMCKARDRGMTIEGVHLVYKSGGKSGVYEAAHKD